MPVKRETAGLLERGCLDQQPFNEMRLAAFLGCKKIAEASISLVRLFFIAF
jgi:hypothetical protein